MGVIVAAADARFGSHKEGVVRTNPPIALRAKWPRR